MGSIWNREVDTALVKLLKNTVKYVDENGDIQVPNIIVRNPEGDFVDRKYPIVSFFNYDQKFAKVRYNHNPVRIKEEDSIDGTAKFIQPAFPYDLYYQIDFWSEYQTDINEITRSWAGSIPPNTILEVEDSKGNIRHCVMNFVEQVEMEEKKEDNTRIFHRAYSYKIWVELNERNPVYKDIVTNLLEIEEVQDW